MTFVACSSPPFGWNLMPPIAAVPDVFGVIEAISRRALRGISQRSPASPPRRPTDQADAALAWHYTRWPRRQRYRHPLHLRVGRLTVAVVKAPTDALRLDAFDEEADEIDKVRERGSGAIGRT